MSGVFTLLTNDGKADSLIMATAFLNRRIQHIMCARKTHGDTDVMPTLKDIEKTHLLFVNAHFKPFCAMGHEYQKVRMSSGTATLGSTVQFAIPQFGDFFADMAMRASLSVVNSSSQAVPTSSIAVDTVAQTLTDITYPGSNLSGVTPLDWDGSLLAVVPKTVIATYSLVDVFGNAVAASTYYRNLVRYVEFPGERLCQEVKFDVNGNALDLYEDVATVMMRKFTLPHDKEVGYKRLCGQEVELCGYSGSQRGKVYDNNLTSLTAVALTEQNSSGSGASVKTNNQQVSLPVTEAAFLQTNFPDEAWYASTASGAALGGVTQSATVGYQSVYREVSRAVDGLQTAKLQQPATDLWCKLRFWFNERIDQAVPSVAIPSGQRYISVELATAAQLVVEAPMLYIKRVLDSGISDVPTLVNTRTVEYRPYFKAGTLSDMTVGVELYVNNLFVNPEIHDIYINRIGFTLIRVFRMHKQTVSTPTSDDKLLSQLKWPIEYMFVGLRPVWNSNINNNTMYRDWHRMCKVVDIENQEWASTSSVRTAATAVTTDTSSQERSVVPVRYEKELKTFDTLTLSAHGIKIFDTFSEKFFSAYVPYAFGGPNIVTPKDEGCLMFNFALYPGVYQPSGHINVSRAREFYLNWTSAYTTATNSCELIVVCKAINFLLIANGSAVLRFST
jgi:Large eukaryotic DNA virus major capsid protein